MFEYLSIIMASVSVFVSLINLIVSNKKKQEETADLFQKEKADLFYETLQILNKSHNNPTNDLEVQNYLSHLSKIIKKMYPSAKTEISLHILKKDNENIENSTVENWISLPSSARYNYIVKNNTGFKSLLLENNKYFFVSDLNKYESISNYINENPEHTNWQTTIVFPIRTNKSNSTDIIGFLCVVSPEKFNNVKNNKKIISFFSKATDLLSDAITNKLEDISKSGEVTRSINFLN